MRHIPITEQLADIYTKALPKVAFQKIRFYLILKQIIIL